MGGRRKGANVTANGVRMARLTDARGIATVQVLGWQKAYQGIVSQVYLDEMSVDAREERWLSNLADPAAITLVWVEDAEVVGWVSVGRSRDEDAGPRVGEVWGFYILPRCWGQGYAARLWQEARIYLISQGYEEVTLLVLERNLRAQHFYRKLGFVQEPGWVKSFEIGGFPLEELRLRMDLRSQACSTPTRLSHNP